MLTAKQKRYLKSLGMTQEPIVQIGKAGVTATVVAGTEAALLARELVKVRVLNNSPQESKEAIQELAIETGAQLVQVIGHNGLLYKRNSDPEKSKLELP